MKSRVLNTLAAFAMLLPLSGQAAEFGYSFVDFSIIPEAETDGRGFDIDGDGYQLRGSLAVTNTFFALVEISAIDFDERAVDVDFTRWLIGGGGHWPITRNLDFIARGGVVRYDVDYGAFDDDDIGFFAGARVRAQIVPNVELEGGIDITTAEVRGFEDEVTIVGEGRYHINNQFSIGGLINLGDDTSQIGVYGRFNF